MRRLHGLGEDLPHGPGLHPGPARSGGPRHHPRQQDEGLLHPPARLPRLRGPRRQPVPLPDRRGDPALGMGHVPRRRRPRERRRRQGELVVADGARLVPVARQDERQLRQRRSSSRWKPSSTATPRASPSTASASSARARARTSSSSATARCTRRRWPPSILPGITRDSVITLAREPRLSRPRGDAAPRDALHRRRALLRRHRRGDHADPLGRPDRHRRPARAARSPPPSSRRSSTSSTARCPTRTTGSPTSTGRGRPAAAGRGRKG